MAVSYPNRDGKHPYFATHMEHNSAVKIQGPITSYTIQRGIPVPSLTDRDQLILEIASLDDRHANESLGETIYLETRSILIERVLAIDEQINISLNSGTRTPKKPQRRTKDMSQRGWLFITTIFPVMGFIAILAWASLNRDTGPTGIGVNTGFGKIDIESTLAPEFEYPWVTARRYHCLIYVEK
ncbi:MAG: hypothetical protein CM1200mP35_04730 [Chloroflexota bacterium]|nr:MAG: hypothetical protein CM1200mP35_04730 [Chloroflexota bacterium]